MIRGTAYGRLTPALVGAAATRSPASAERGERRDGHGRTWLLLLTLLCGATGIAAGVQPRLGLLVPLGLAFVAVVFTNLTLGLFLFTILSWLHVVTAGGGAALSVTKVLGLILLVSWLAAQSNRGELKPRSLYAMQPKLAIAAAGLLTWTTVSVAWAYDRGVALTTAYTLLLDLLLFPIVFTAIRRREHFIWIVAAFVFGGVISALIGVMQPSNARATGALGDADGEATLLATTLILLIGLTAALPRRSPLRLLAGGGAAIALAGLVNTGSRGGLVALACGLAVAIVFGGRWRSKALVALLVGAASVGLYLSTIAPSTATQHFSTTNSTGRSDLWRVGLRMWEANPLLGVGAGNYANASVKYIDQPGQISNGQYIVSENPKPVHNTYLEQLDDLGVPGLIGFLAVTVVSIAAALKAARTYERLRDTRAEIMARCLALAIVTQLSGAFFITNTPEKLLWLLLALPFPLLAVAEAEARLVPRMTPATAAHDGLVMTRR